MLFIQNLLSHRFLAHCALTLVFASLSFLSVSSLPAQVLASNAPSQSAPSQSATTQSATTQARSKVASAETESEQNQPDATAPDATAPDATAPAATAPDATASDATASNEADPLLELPPAPAEVEVVPGQAASVFGRLQAVLSGKSAARSTPAPAGATQLTGEWTILDQPILDQPAKGVVPGASTPPASKPVIARVNSSFSSESLRAITTRLKLALPLKNARIVVDKSERRLDLFSGKILVKSYRVALGSNPSGHKQKQGDGRTPEGHFYICTRNAKTSAFHIFLGLSYPGVPDAKRAVNSKQITWREYQIIHQRLASRGRPLWETRLGGWVGIHGGTDARYAQKTARARGNSDWTAGCVALTNREIEEIHAATKLGTPVEIKP